MLALLSTIKGLSTRNWSESLAAKEQWRHFCEARLLQGLFGNELTFDRFRELLEEIVSSSAAKQQPELFRRLLDQAG